MECHDGSRASDARTGHKFDIRYAANGERLRYSPDQFNPNVVLVNGTITCLTCHDPMSKLAFKLAAPLDGFVDARLCVACHFR